jgi:F0F1-type ATP synthase membrane subunit b/b'
VRAGDALTGLAKGQVDAAKAAATKLAEDEAAKVKARAEEEAARAKAEAEKAGKRAVGDALERLGGKKK